jgi:LPXTG-motif cell wall-anchored protein
MFGRGTMMKKFALALITVSAVVFGFGAAANAATDPVYPPPTITVTVSSQTPAPGSTITVTSQGCEEGETVNFVLEGSSSTGTTTGGTASGQVTVPTTPGTYTGTATCASGAAVNFTVTVTTPSGGLPATGSSGISSTVAISGILLLVGAGLLTVSQIRRRQAATA